jgi:hypothetical protein
MVRRSFLFISLLTPALCAGLAVAAPAGAASGPVALTKCGTVVSTDAYLVADLTCAAGTGVTVTAGNVTLDLRGHRLVGPGRRGNGFVGSTAIGVTTELTADTVRVTDGAVVGWGTGIDAGGGGSVQADLVRIAHGSRGLAMSFAGGVVDRSRIIDVDEGITGSVELSRSTIYGGQTGVSVFEGFLHIESSTISHEATGVSCQDASCEILNSRIVKNEIGVGSGTGASLDLNHVVVRSNWTGVVTSAFGGAHIANSRFTGNDIGVKVVPTSTATVEQSAFGYNKVGVQIPAAPDDDRAPTADLQANQFRYNRDGLLVTNRNAVTSLGHNTAYSNTRWGLYAAGQVTDLGGNVAFDNGARAQCFGVVCAAQPSS